MNLGQLFHLSKLLVRVVRHALFLGPRKLRLLRRLRGSRIFEPQLVKNHFGLFNRSDFWLARFLLAFGFEEGSYLRRVALHHNTVLNATEDIEDPFPSRTERIRQRFRSRNSLAILVHSQSGWQMKLHGLVLQSVLEDLGHPVTLVDENSDLALSRETPIVVAPHEFWHFDLPRHYRKNSFRRSAIVYQTEQPETQWFRESIESILEARAVIDVSLITQRLYSTSVPSISLNLPFDRRAMDNVGVEPSNISFFERPYDLCFFGQPNPFRNYTLKRLAETLKEYKLSINYFSLSGGEQSSWAEFGRFFETSQLSKIHLSITRSAQGFFTWNRIIVGGLGAGALALTARSTPTRYPSQGQHFISSSAIQLPRLVDYFLSNPDGQETAERIASEGHAFVQKDALRSEAVTKLKRLMRAVGM